MINKNTSLKNSAIAGRSSAYVLLNKDIRESI